MNCTSKSHGCVATALLGAFVLSWAGCDPPDQPPTNTAAVSPPGARAESVAEAQLASGAKLEIFALADGTFLASQSGDAKAAAMRIDPAMIAAGDPVALFKELAPTQPIPERLTLAAKRALDQSETSSAEPAEPNATPRDLVSDGRAGAPSGAPIRQAIESATGSTGSPGCPWEFFDAHDGQTYCRGAGDTGCFRDVSWAYGERNNAWDGQATLCSQAGNPRLQLVIDNNLVFSETVPAGTWKTVFLIGHRSCNWWHCWEVRGYRKFDYPYDGTSYGQFGLKLD